MFKVSIGIILVYLTVFSAFSQVDIDALYATCVNTKATEKIKNGSTFQCTYHNESENTNYQFSTDKNGKIVENDWGLSLTITKLDSLKRPIEIKHYQKDGQLFEADSPPIVKLSYNDTLSIKCVDYYNADLSFEGRIEIQSDDKGREIAFVAYDKKLLFEQKQLTEYVDSENAYYKKYYDAKNKLTKNDCGVAIWYVQLNEPGGFEIARKYFDKDMNLVECTHEDSELVYSYNIATQIGDSNEWKMNYYTNKGQIVRSFIFKTE